MLSAIKCNEDNRQ